MKMYRLVLTNLFLLFGLSSLVAQKDLYIAKGACMHELYYAHTGAGQVPGHSDFHLQLNDSTVLVVSVVMSPESRQRLQAWPSELDLECGRAANTITPAEVREVNGARRAAWFVESAPDNTFNRYPVRELSLIVETPRYFKWIRAVNTIYFDLVNEPQVEITVSTTDSPWEAVYMNRSAFSINGKAVYGYSFLEKPTQGTAPDGMSTFFPGIGPVTIVSGNDTLDLVMVDKQPIMDFLTLFADVKMRLRNVAPEAPALPVEPAINPAADNKPIDNPVVTPPVADKPSVTPADQPVQRVYQMDANGYYTVQAGDNLGIVAQNFKVELEKLRQWNRLGDANALTVGQKLLVRSASDPAVPPVQQVPVMDGVHVVRKGESLYDISDRYKVSLTELMTLNELNSFDLVEGQRIVYRAGAKPQQAPKPREARIGYHIVKPGETLNGLAKQYSTTVKDLIEWNGMANAEVRVGDEIRVQRPANVNPPPPTPQQQAPAKPIAPNPPGVTTHTVAPGETLSAISKKYGIGVADLKRINGLTTDVINIGQVLRVSLPSATGQQSTPPQKLPVPQTPEAPKQPAPAKPTAVYHTVAKGETLYRIAQNYGTTVGALGKLNNLGNSSEIQIGQQLRVK